MANISNSNTPLLLVHSGNANTSDETPNLVIETANFDALLRKVDTRPISIFTIAGPQKTGKSLLFGYFVKYLTAAEKDSPEWINWKDEKQPLEDPNWSKTRASPITPGIWSYYRPFILDNDGTEIAVLLLYLQSTDKARLTENRTMAALSGLSLLASSCTIFNVTKDVDENSLAALSMYVAQALSTVDTEKHQHASFQNVSLLIRDWNFPTEYPYGCSGGREYFVVEKLPIKSCQQRDCRENRQLITHFLKNTSACLLPFPGNDTVKPSFRGSLKELDTHFVEFLRDFITDTLDVDDVPISKDIDGNPLTIVDLKKLFETYIDSVNYNTNNILQPADILKALGTPPTLFPEDEATSLKIAIQAHTNAWLRSFDKTADLTNQEVQELHTKCVVKALKALKKEMFPFGHDYQNDGAKAMHKKAEKQLKDILEERYKEYLQKINEDRFNSLQEMKLDLVYQYKDLMLRAYPPGSKIPPEKRLRKESETNLTRAKLQLRTKIGENRNELTEHIFQELCDELMVAENQIISTILQKNTSTGESGRQSLDLARNSDLEFERRPAFEFEKKSTLELGRKSTLDFKNLSITQETPQDFGSQEERDRLHNFTPKPEIPRNKFYQSVKENLDKDRQTSGVKTRQKTAEEHLKERAQSLLENLKQEYSKSLTTYLEKDAPDLDNFTSKLQSHITAKYKNDSPFDEDSTEYQLYEDVLLGELKVVMSQAKSKQKQANKAKQSKYEQLVKVAVFRYEEHLDQYLIDNPNLSHTHIGKMHHKFYEAELEHLEESMPSSEFNQAKIKMSSECENILERLKSRYGRKLQDQENFLLRLVNDLKTEYKEKLGRIVGAASTEAELKNQHEKIKSGILHIFHLKSKDNPNFKNYATKLETGIESLYQEMLFDFQIQQKGDAASQKFGIQEAHRYYKEEMRKHFQSQSFMQIYELAQLHSKISAAALKKCPSNLDSKLLKELKDSIAASFEMYKDENNMNLNTESAIGIDLGTTFSCVAVYQKGEVKIIPNSDGNYTTPSYVLFDHSGEEVVGLSAKERAYENPEGTIFDAKRILGRKFDDPKLQNDMKLWPFTVVDGGRGIPKVEVNGKRLDPEIISAKVLTQLKKDAEVYLKKSVTKAVITVPAYFTDGQKQATVDAGKMAGLEVMSIITEPVAAAMAYRLQYANGIREGNSERHILVFDLGGGTFDVAILKTKQGKIEVLTVDGDTHLGGEDFDRNLMDYCAAEFKKTHNIDLFAGKDSNNKKIRDQVRRTLKRLQAECERQKIRLASAPTVRIHVEGIHEDKDLIVTVNRATFEKINEPLFLNTIQVVSKALKEAKLNKSQIDDIVMVGGSTRIPKIQSLLKNFFDGKELDQKINPDEAVAHGAGLLAAIKKGNVSSNDAAFTKIQDVTPMPIGIEVYGGGFSTLIPKSTKIPVKVQEKYRTAHNNQTSVQITIYEGEDKIAVKNKHLGDFYLNGIPPREAEKENIDVEMLINDQGILHVTACVTSTGRKNSVTVTENKQRMGQAAIAKYIAGR